MAKELTPGVGDSVTLAATVTQLSLPAQFAPRRIRTLVIYESDVDLFVVTSGAATDGGALPATGYVSFRSTALPQEYNVGAAGFVGLAAGGAGTCRVEVR